MKPIQDAAQIEWLVHEHHIDDRFDTPNLVFSGRQYQKGELLGSPLLSTDSLLFLVQGSVLLYDLRDDGSKVPLAIISGDVVIGDTDFIINGSAAFFMEAATDCICLSLPLEEYREALSRDVRFRCSLLGSVADKFLHSTEDNSASLEEKVVDYLRKDVEEHEIREIEPLLTHLRCGRLQLQRAIRSLCDSGKLVRLGRGRYRLNTPAPRDKGRRDNRRTYLYPSMSQSA